MLNAFTASGRNSKLKSLFKRELRGYREFRVSVEEVCRGEFGANHNRYSPEGYRAVLT